ncbi:hypothetical protein GYH30_029396 [Glycine max]|uniref:Uncharacterized protein n=1 Tax=Glycine max TaxID=3847 RepID=A0A0R0I7M2_SOYBN|nr:hypothetical protein GYH30_029396 [Glycine max]
MECHCDFSHIVKSDKNLTKSRCHIYPIKPFPLPSSKRKGKRRIRETGFYFSVCTQQGTKKQYSEVNRLNHPLHELIHVLRGCLC